MAESVLTIIAVTDLISFIIPPTGVRIIFLLGILRCVIHHSNWHVYIAGMFAVSLPLYLLYRMSHGRLIGGGDIKLMAAAGLVTGWQLIIISFMLGMIYAAVIHPIRMKFFGSSHVLALGPYLTAGIITAVLYGESIWALL